MSLALPSRLGLGLAVLCLGIAPAQARVPAPELVAYLFLQQAEMHPILYDDCGLAGSQPHVVSPRDWRYGDDEVECEPSARTVAFGEREVKIRYDGLDAGARYAVRIVYATESWQARTQTLTADGVSIHDALELPLGTAETYQFDVPSQVVTDEGVGTLGEIISEESMVGRGAAPSDRDRT